MQNSLHNNQDAAATAILLAAGTGSRFSENGNKVYRKLGGQTVLSHSLAAMLRHPGLAEILLVIRPGEESEAEEAVRGAYALAGSESAGNVRGAFGPADLVPGEGRVHFVYGGERRTDSVRHAVEEARGEIVLIHDGTRPFLLAEYIDTCLHAMEKWDGAAIGVPMQDTVKKTDPEGRIISTVPRRDLMRVQTPQCFRRDALLSAMKTFGSDPDITDDCMLLERAGGSVLMLPGHNTNIKITTQEDLLLAEAILAGRGGL